MIERRPERQVGREWGREVVRDRQWIQVSSERPKSPPDPEDQTGLLQRAKELTGASRRDPEPDRGLPGVDDRAAKPKQLPQSVG